MRSGIALRELVRVRILGVLREPEALFWTFVFPIVLAIVLGLAFQSEDRIELRVGVVRGAADPDGLRRAPAFRSGVLEVGDLDEGLARLRSGAIDGLVALAGEPPAAQVYFDPRRPESELARRDLESALALPADRPWPAEGATATPIGKTGARYVDFLLPGLIGMTLMGSGIWGVGFAVVDTRQRKLLKRFLVTPMPRSSFLLSIMLSRMILLVPEITIIALFGALVMNVPLEGPLSALFVVGAAGSFCFAGLGILVASRVQTIEGVSGLMNLVLLPMWLTGGIFFSYERFPAAVLPLIRLTPLAPLNDAFRAVMLEGRGLVDVWPETVIVFAWGLASFLLALRIFRWS